MRHEEFRARLHDLVDGSASQAERLELQAHAETCSECARELEAVREVVDAARRLPRSLEPPRDLWPGIEAAIGAGAPAPIAARRAADRRRRWIAWPQPAWPRWAAAAAVAGLAVVLLVVGRDRDAGRRAAMPRQAASGTQLFPAALSGLELECKGAGELLQASFQLPAGPRTRETAASLAAGLVSGLAIVDRSIDETQQALIADPENPELQRMLAARYQQKLALLHAALLRVDTT